MEDILANFPDLSALQQDQFAQLEPLYREWNARINVISRKNIDRLYPEHVLHSLAIARVAQFRAGARIVDVGCGGGFPGIPLAILYPECRFTLVDSIGKKIRVVSQIASSLGLSNVEACNCRVEQLDGRFDFAVSRAVTRMNEFVGWVWNKLESGSGNARLDNGILYLKGGDLDEELAEIRKPYALYDIAEIFSDPFFETKKVVYIPR